MTRYAPLSTPLSMTTTRFFSDKKPKKAAAPPPPKPAPAASPEDPARHRPPIALSGLAARYANATYVVASKANMLDRVEQEVAALAATTSPAMHQFLHNPLIPRDAKYKVVQSLDQLSPITRNLLSVLAGNARLSEWPKIAAAFAQLGAARRGLVDVQVTVAAPLTAEQLAAVQAALPVPPGKTVRMRQVTNPAITGGLQVQMGDAFLDLSVQAQVERFAKMPVA